MWRTVAYMICGPVGGLLWALSPLTPDPDASVIMGGALLLVSLVLLVGSHSDSSTKRMRRKRRTAREKKETREVRERRKLAELKTKYEGSSGCVENKQ